MGVFMGYCLTISTLWFSFLPSFVAFVLTGQTAPTPSEISREAANLSVLKR